MLNQYTVEAFLEILTFQVLSDAPKASVVSITSAGSGLGILHMSLDRSTLLIDQYTSTMDIGSIHPSVIFIRKACIS